ncbi:MAG: Asp/Glu racemase [Candidatus Solibacter sp.]|nr:Asp/Glu racemase [Candidatus Solibacter sp.]
MRKLGLIGGLGPGATIHYYRELAESNAGEMLLIHADMAYGLSFVERGDRDGLASYFARLIGRMADGGAEVAAISAITPHICIRELEKITPLPLVNIVTGIASEIRARGYRRVALFGTRFVVQSRMFGMLEGVEVIVPEQVELIHETYMRIVNGAGDEARETLARIAKTLPVDAIVLAGTDLSLVFNKSNIDFPCVDGAEVHLRAIMRELTA